jgi:hypothetical protein
VIEIVPKLNVPVPLLTFANFAVGAIVIPPLVSQEAVRATAWPNSIAWLLFIVIWPASVVPRPANARKAKK